MDYNTRKPLGSKSYGSIGHLPNSRLGPGDHCVSPGQARICTEKKRDQYDVIIVQEKTDGSNVGAARIEDDILPLTRAGYLATTSPYEQHHVWAAWVRKHRERFLRVLEPGERLCGEWLYQVHSTRYNLPHEPFICFDLMRGKDRTPYDSFVDRVSPFVIPRLISYGAPINVETVKLALTDSSYHGAIDPIEGAVWRVERHDKVDFLAKWVYPGKEDGKYLPEFSGQPAIYNCSKGDLLR